MFARVHFAVHLDEWRKALLITHGNDYTIGHDLKDGHEVWRVGKLNGNPNSGGKGKGGDYNATFRFVASPVCTPDLISSHPRRTARLSPSIPGPTARSILIASSPWWRKKAGTPDVSCPLVYDGLVYIVRENGNLQTWDAKTEKKNIRRSGCTKTSISRIARVGRRQTLCDGSRWCRDRCEGGAEVRDPGREPLDRRHLGVTGHRRRPDLSGGFKNLYAIGSRVWACPRFVYVFATKSRHPYLRKHAFSAAKWEGRTRVPTFFADPPQAVGPRRSNSGLTRTR